MKTKEKIFIYKDHSDNKWYQTNIPTFITEEEIEIIKNILSLYSEYGTPDFKNYKPITFSTRDFDDDGNVIDDSDYETPLISMRGDILEFEDVTVYLSDIGIDSLNEMFSIMKSYAETQESLAQEERDLIHEATQEMHKEKILALIPQCKSEKLKKVLKNIYDRCLYENLELYVEDQTDYKFDVEIEEDFGENVLSYLEEGLIDEELEIDGWEDAPLDADYAKLLRRWKWKNVELINGDYVIVYREDEDWDKEYYYIGIFSSKNLQDGQIEMKAWGFI